MPNGFRFAIGVNVNDIHSLILPTKPSSHIGNVGMKANHGNHLRREGT